MALQVPGSTSDERFGTGPVLVAAVTVDKGQLQRSEAQFCTVLLFVCSVAKK